MTERPIMKADAAPKAMTPAELPAAFHDYIVKSVSLEGWPLAPGWILSKTGELTVLAMDLTPEQVYSAMLTQVELQDAAAFIFAIDRFAKPGQGTIRSDLLAGHVWTGEPTKVRPFIIEYDPATGIVDPMNFDNSFWTVGLNCEMIAVASRNAKRPPTTH